MIIQNVSLKYVSALKNNQKKILLQPHNLKLKLRIYNNKVKNGRRYRNKARLTSKSNFRQRLQPRKIQ